MRVDDVAIAIEYNYLSYNLVQYRGWIYAVPQKLGPSFNLGELEEEALNVLIRSKSLSGLKARLIAGKYFMRLITNIHEYKIFSIIKKFK